MLKTSASRLVLGILIGIAALELGISGKFAAIWQLAFVGKSATPTTASSPTVAGGKPSLR